MISLTSKLLTGVLFTILTVAGVVFFNNFYVDTNQNVPVVTEEISAAESNSNTVNLEPSRLLFIQNNGQWNKELLYHVQGSGLNVSFYSNKIEFAQSNAAKIDKKVRLTFSGANQSPTVNSGNKLKSQVHFYVGNESDKWLHNIATYSDVTYHQLYDGIDLKYIGENAQLESEFYVAAGTDYKNIRFRYEGTESVKLGENGELILKTTNGLLVERPPFAYQEVNGEKVEISSKYALLADGNIGFELGKYDRNKTVVIDPELLFITTAGDKIGAWASDMAVDADENIIAVGASYRFFPATTEIEGSNHDPGFSNDGLLLKVDGKTGDILQSALFGGNKYDVFESVAIADNGNIYVTGSTDSDNFPIKNATQDTYGGSQDAFLVVFNAQLSLLSSRYIGGKEVDSGEEIAIDGSGNVFVGCTTESDDIPNVNGFQKTQHGNYDLVVLKCDANGNSIFTSYLGGSGNDQIRGLAVDASGQVTVVSNTLSTDFPLKNAFQATFGGEHWGTGDLAVSQFNAEGTDLNFSTYFGGSVEDWATGVIINNDVISVSGGSMSPDFPVVNNAQDTSSTSSGVLIQLDASGQPLLSARTSLPSQGDFRAIAKGDSNSVYLYTGNEDSLYFYQYTPPVISDQQLSFKSGSNIDIGTFALKMTLEASGADITSMEFYYTYLYYVGSLIDYLSSITALAIAGIQMEDPPKVEDQFTLDYVGGFLEISFKENTRKMNLEVDDEGFLRLNGLKTKFKAKDIIDLKVFGSQGDDEIKLNKVNTKNFPKLENYDIYSGDGDDNVSTVAVDIHLKIIGGGGADYIMGGFSDDDITIDMKDRRSDGYEGNDIVRLIFQYLVVTLSPPIYTKSGMEENVLVLADKAGIDTISFALFENEVKFNSSLLNTPQLIDDFGSSIQLEGQFEAINGSPQNDVFSVAPLSGDVQIVNGSDGVDTLHYLSDLPATDDGTKIMANGMVNVVYDSIEVVILHGGSSTSVNGIIADGSQISLQAFPNPFSQDLNFTYFLHETASVQLIIMDLQGKTIVATASVKNPPGENSIQVPDLKANLNAGVYIYQLNIDKKKYTGRIVKNR